MGSRMKIVARKPAKNFSSPKVPQLDFYQKVRIIAKEKRFATPFFFAPMGAAGGQPAGLA
jgi:hypothetical protein